MRFSLIGLCAAFSISMSIEAMAQGPEIIGRAFDSLSHRPLVGAVLVVDKQGIATQTGAEGAFTLRGAAMGRQRIFLSHSSLDSLGLSELALDLQVSPAETLKVFVPSHRTFWIRTCGDEPVPTADAGVLFGSVRVLPSGNGLSDARVRVSWSAVELDSTKRNVKSSQWGGSVVTDARGLFHVCGLPRDESITLQAAAPGMRPVSLLFPPLTKGVFRAEITLAPLDLPTGVIAGFVHNRHGQPVAGARVTLIGGGEVRSVEDGSFTVTNVAPGSRMLEVSAIGSAPSEAVVVVPSNDTARVAFALSTIISLDPVHVTALTARQRRREALAERRQAAIGKFMDSTEVATMPSIVSAASTMINPRQVCALFIDGVRIAREDIARELHLRSPRDVAVLEAHRGSDPTLPMQYRERRCGGASGIVMLVWTRHAW